jgi:hypothetical protein
MKECIICGKLPARKGFKTCSRACSWTHHKADKIRRREAYQKTDEYKAYQKAYLKNYRRKRKL